MAVSFPLVEVAELAVRIGDPRLRVLDASWHLPGAGRDARAEHAAARIPGAVFFDIDLVADTTSGLPHMLPSPAELERHAAELGLGADSAVVVYDQVGLFSAARVWWTLRALGHDAVQVLNGGLPAWRAAGLPVEAGPARAAPHPGRALEARARPELVRDLEAMRAIVAGEGAQVVDARPAARFAGSAPEPRPGLRGGHMPGARNVPHAALLDAQGRLRPPAELRAILEEAGVGLERPIVTTCGSGVTAAVVALALAVLGRLDVAVYDGSWTEWGARADVPVVTGPAT